MTVGEQAELVVNISLRDQFTPAVKKLQTNLKTLDIQTAQLQRGVGKVAQGIGKGLKTSAVIAAGAVGLLATQVRAGITELLEWEDASLQVTAAIKSTNAAAGVNLETTQALAEKYAALSLAEDDVILASQALLLRFPRITKDAFEPALAASLDLSQALGMDLPTATKTVARALNDPIKGLSRLERAGVSFTEQEKKKITRLQESGRELEAQRVILNRLNRVYGGSATQATVGYRGKVKLLTDRIKDLQQALAGPLLGPLTDITTKLTEFASSEEVKQGITDLGEGIASLVTTENLQTGFDAIKSGFGFLRDLPWDQIKQGLQTTADLAARAIGLFQGLPPEVQSGLVTLLAANKLTGGLVASGLGDIATFVLRNLTTINAAVVNVVGASVKTGLDVPNKGPKDKGLLSLLNPKNLLAAFSTALGVGAAAGATTLASGALLSAGLALGVTGAGYNGPARPYRPGDPTNILRTNASPGTAGVAASAALKQLALQRNVVDRLTKLAASSDEGNAKATDIWTRLGEGNITYKQAKEELNKIRESTRETKEAVQAQKTEVNLNPQINISAADTGNAITLAATGSRIVIR